MTRLIDVDALERVILDNSYLIVHDGTSVEQGMSCHGVMQAIAEAPTIEPSGDLISKESALAEFQDGRDVYDIMESIEGLPSAETSTASEKHQLSEETSTNTSTDLISRQDAVKEIDSFCDEVWTESEADFARGLGTALSIVESLPSAEPKTKCIAQIRIDRDDMEDLIDEKVNEIVDKMAEPNLQPTCNQLATMDGDFISRQDVIELVKKSYYDLSDGEEDMWAMVHDVEQLPSAEVEDRLYIKIYADDEPSVKAEKLYQICDETQNREVAEWLKEYFPSAPDSRQRGEWVRKYDGHINCYWYECDQCGEYRPRNQFGHEYNANFCPNCGADMKGQNDGQKR